MDTTINHMDVLDRETLHRLLAPMPRSFPGKLPVRSVGYFQAKRSWVRRTSPRQFFLIILSGAGEFRTGGVATPIRAPCVISHGTGVHAEYGPTREWEELYLTYAPEQVRVLREMRLLPAGRPVWHVHHAASLRRQAAELLEVLRDPQGFGCADRADRICERLLLDSLISTASPPMDQRARAIRAAQAKLDGNCREPLDLLRLAAEHGFSPASFRRHWKALTGVSPARYVTLLRIREACRLLVETGEDVARIALAVGFNDPLYFSRKFRQVVGETATAYRWAHRPADDSAPPSWPSRSGTTPRRKSPAWPRSPRA
jgi:AraC-like DNA-binding protein